MRILIDHLTRMSAGYICVAGLNEDGDHVRPVLEHGRIRVENLIENGGVFALGATVDLAETRHVGSAPEHEDHEFDPEAVKLIEGPDDQELWRRLKQDAELSLVDIFGRDLQNRRPGAVVPLGAGRASLGTLECGYRPRLQMDDRERPRCILNDPDLGELDLSVTDIRFYSERGGEWIPDSEVVDKVAEGLAADRPHVLSLGLGRPWPPNDPAHWLQVNGIHLEPTIEKTGPAYSVEEIRKIHPNAYKSWTDEDEELLRLLVERDVALSQMAEILGRQRGGISSRLRHLGLVD